ncbi:MAG: FAD-dependent thymidylate synthase [bacterium]
MEIILAGMNIDKTLLDEHIAVLRKTLENLEDSEKSSDITTTIQELLDRNNLTPETLSAAYARISRDPRPVNQLREDARIQVGKARRSNRNIIFGLGHSSVAEHAVFNLDILGVSRLLSEILQSHRLCSFTEKSQRYIRLDQDYYVPEPIRQSIINKEFNQFVKDRFNDYRILTELIEKDLNHYPESAAEDARYVLPLCTTTQMGMTLNARNLEMLLQQAASSTNAEFNEFGNRLFSIIDGVAPSIIKYTQASSRKIDMENAVKSLVLKHFISARLAQPKPAESVRLLFWTPDGDRLVAGALLSRLGIALPQELDSSQHDYPPDLLRQIFLEIFRHMKPWDSAPREFEYADFLFEINLSAAAFAQLKRHRMATITAGDYDFDLPIAIPPVLRETRGESILKNASEESRELIQKISLISSESIPYAVLSCHRRRVLLKTNARELIHLSRLREDEHAQWDIRECISTMVHLAREKLPGCLLPACGKHAFENYRKELSLNSFDSPLN